MKLIKELYAYREMIFSLVKKDLRGRYKGSVLGFLWTFINPLCQIIIYTLVFSVIMRSGIEKFYLFLIVGLIPWIFFSSSINGGAISILTQQDLVKKIYFPREVLPISYVTSSFVNMLFSFIIVFIVLFISGVGVNPSALVFLPIVMIVEYILALGIALIASACTVFFRDLEHILSIITMAWMYLTPIMYSVDMVPEKIIQIFNLNPMTPVIIAYRDILYYKKIPQIETLLQATIIGITILIIGTLVFSRLQRNFAEEL
ncbi:MAG TPA: ABC transporter permease [Bacteroidales bacterium]|nr:ABC transporter permease [Bacteroidales bacterium]